MMTGESYYMQYKIVFIVLILLAFTGNSVSKDPQIRGYNLAVNAEFDDIEVFDPLKKNGPLEEIYSKPVFLNVSLPCEGICHVSGANKKPMTIFDLNGDNESEIGLLYYHHDYYSDQGSQDLVVNETDFEQNESAEAGYNGPKMPDFSLNGTKVYRGDDLITMDTVTFELRNGSFSPYVGAKPDSHPIDTIYAQRASPTRFDIYQKEVDLRNSNSNVTYCTFTLPIFDQVNHIFVSYGSSGGEKVDYTDQERRVLQYEFYADSWEFGNYLMSRDSSIKYGENISQVERSDYENFSFSNELIAITDKSTIILTKPEDSSFFVTKDGENRDYIGVCKEDLDYNTLPKGSNAFIYNFKATDYYPVERVMTPFTTRSEQLSYLPIFGTNRSKIMDYQVALVNPDQSKKFDKLDLSLTLESPSLEFSNYSISYRYNGRERTCCNNPENSLEFNRYVDLEEVNMGGLFLEESFIYPISRYQAELNVNDKPYPMESEKKFQVSNSDYEGKLSSNKQSITAALYVPFDKFVLVMALFSLATLSYGFMLLELFTNKVPDFDYSKLTPVGPIFFSFGLITLITGHISSIIGLASLFYLNSTTILIFYVRFRNG